MGVLTLHSDRDELAVMYCSTSGWAFGPVFHTLDGHGDDEEQCGDCPHYPNDLIDLFLKWFESGDAVIAAGKLGIRPIGFGNGRDPRDYTEAELGTLYGKWRLEEPWRKRESEDVEGYARA